MTKTGMFMLMLTGLLAASVGSCIIRTNETNNEKLAAEQAAAVKEAAKSPAQKASEAKAKAAQKAAEEANKARAEAEFQFGVLATKLVKASMKNPASFEFVEAGIVNNGALCLTYRATNSFNAVITEHIAVTRKLAKGSWNKECGGKRMPSFDHIKYAL